MVNILLERYMIDAEWLFDDLKEYIKPHYKVAVIAFSFRENRIKSLSDWNGFYGKEKGNLYRGIVDSFESYGIKEENIEFLNYFSDTKKSAEEKIRNADILYFPGGLPDKMYERINEFELLDVISNHNKVAMGYSAGAVIQLEEYHLTPDDDYDEFSYNKGIPFLKGFFVEVHYNATRIQKKSIKRVLSEKKKTVYAMHETGAIITDNGKIKLLGDVEKFEP